MKIFLQNKKRFWYFICKVYLIGKLLKFWEKQWNSQQEETESTSLLHRVAIACIDWVCLSRGTRSEVGKTGAMFPGAMDPFQTLSLTNCVLLAYFSPTFSQRGNRDDDLALSHGCDASVM